MGLRQPVTVETESSGIEGGNLWRKTLELKKEEEGGEGKEEGKGGEERGDTSFCSSMYITHSAIKPVEHRGW